MSCLGLILAAALLWLLQCTLYQHLWKRGLNVSVSFDQTTAVEGELATLTETITNAKYLPLPALHIKFQMGRELVFTNGENSKITDRNYRSDIFSCLSWQQIIRKPEFRCCKRGVYSIRQLDLVSYDLLWSSHFYAVLPADTTLTVYPAFVDAARLELPLRELNGAMAAHSMLLRDPFEFQSIRGYTPQDPYRDINWKATARTGDLKINVHAPASYHSVTLLLNCDSDRLWADQDLKEEAVRICATLADTLISQGIPTALRTNACDGTGAELRTEHGAGRDHTEMILRTLAYADLNAPDHRRMEALIDEFTCSDEAANRCGNELYILISSCRHDRLVKACAALCRRFPGSQWICPLRPADIARLNDGARAADAAYSLISAEIPAGQFYPWEVHDAGTERFYQ